MRNFNCLVLLYFFVNTALCFGQANESCVTLNELSKKAERFAYKNLDSSLYYAKSSIELFDFCEELKPKAVSYSAYINVCLLRAEFAKAEKVLGEFSILNSENKDYFVNQIYNYNASKYYTYISDYDSAKYYIEKALQFSGGADFEPVLKLQSAIVDYFSGDILSSFAMFMDLMRLYDGNPYGNYVDMYAQLYAARIYGEVNEFELMSHLLLGANEMSENFPIIRAFVWVEQAKNSNYIRDYSQAGVFLEKASIVLKSNQVLAKEFYCQQLQSAYLSNDSDKMADLIEQLEPLKQYCKGDFLLSKAMYNSLVSSIVDSVVESYSLAVNAFDAVGDEYKALVALKLSSDYIRANNVQHAYKFIEDRFLEREQLYRMKKIPLRIRDIEADYNLSLVDRDLKQVTKDYELSIQEL